MSAVKEMKSAGGSASLSSVRLEKLQQPPHGDVEHIKTSHAPNHEHAPGQQQGHGHEDVVTPPSAPLPFFRFFGVLIVAGLAFGGLFVLGWIPRVHKAEALEVESHRIKSSLPLVRVAQPRRSPAIAGTLLPGDVQAMEEITIYPRTTGYVKRWLVDIGDEVTEGQLLAEIDTPEVRAQYQQSEAALAESKATLERARATANLAKITTERLRGLVAKKNVAQQELDDAENNLSVALANIRVAEATIEANKASLQHIQELLTFSEIRSPFAGTVTARHIDTGKLVTSGNGTGQALFQVARTNPVRVFVNVPQIFAPGVVKDLKAEVYSRELPGRVFQGVVTRTARAIDPLTRTLLTEVQVPNEDHALLTGSYVQVKMEVERQSPPLLIPPSSLIFNSGGTQIAVVGPEDQVELRVVDVVGDFGKEIGIASGLTESDRVVINPGDRMSAGVKVEIDDEKPAEEKKPVEGQKADKPKAH